MNSISGKNPNQAPNSNQELITITDDTTPNSNSTTPKLPQKSDATSNQLNPNQAVKNAKTATIIKIILIILLLVIGVFLLSYGIIEMINILNHPIFGLIELPFILFYALTATSGIIVFIKGLSFLFHKK